MGEALKTQNCTNTSCTAIVNTINISNEASKSEKWRVSLEITHVLNTIILCTATLILLNVTLYGYRHRVWNITSQKGKLHIVCITSIISSFPRLLLDQVYYHLHQIPGALEKCELFVDLTNVSYAVAILTAYIFLWMRQWVIHDDPSIRRIVPSWIRPLSWFSLAFIIVVDTVFLCFYVIPPSYESNGLFCVGMKIEQMPEKFKTWAVMKKYFVGGPLLLCQSVLLLLFVFPMARIRMGTNITTPQDHNDVIRRTIRRSSISAIVAIVTDAACLIILGLTPWGSPILVTDVVYNLSILINTVCIIFTFKDSTKIMFAFFWRDRALLDNNAETATSTTV